MAANTPVIWTASATGVRPEILCVLASVYSGSGTLRGRRWQVSKTNSFPASSPNLVYDTQARASDGISQGSDWVDIPLESLNIAPGDTLYVSCIDTNSVPETSSWATAKSFVIVANQFTSAVWAQGQ